MTFNCFSRSNFNNISGHERFVIRFILINIFPQYTLNNNQENIITCFKILKINSNTLINIISKKTIAMNAIIKSKNSFKLKFRKKSERYFIYLSEISFNKILDKLKRCDICKNCIYQYEFLITGGCNKTYKENLLCKDVN